MKKKLLTLVLSLAMVVTMMPFMALSAAAMDYPIFKNCTVSVNGGNALESDFFAAMNYDYGETLKIVLTKDVALEDYHFVGKASLEIYETDMTIDLNGHKLVAAKNAPLFILDDSKLLITDSSAKHTGKVVGSEVLPNEDYIIPETEGISLAPIASVLNGASLRIEGGTFTGGKTTSAGGAFYVESDSQLVIAGKNVVIENNEATVAGGAIFNAGTTEIYNATLRNNKTWGYGGAIATEGDEGGVKLKDCKLTGNHADNAGGALFTALLNPVEINGTTITGNTANGYGGGIAGLGIPNLLLTAKDYIYGNHVGKAQSNVAVKRAGYGQIILEGGFDKDSKVGITAIYDEWFGPAYINYPIAKCTLFDADYSKALVSDVPEVGLEKNPEDGVYTLTDNLGDSKYEAYGALRKANNDSELVSELFYKYVDNETTVAGVKKGLSIALAKASADTATDTVKGIELKVKDEIKNAISKAQSELDEAAKTTAERIGMAVSKTKTTLNQIFEGTLGAVRQTAQRTSVALNKVTDTITGAVLKVANTAMENVEKVIVTIGNTAKRFATKTGSAIGTGARDVVQMQINFINALFGKRA